MGNRGWKTSQWNSGQTLLVQVRPDIRSQASKENATKQKFMKKMIPEPSIVVGRGVFAFQELVRHVLGHKNITQCQLAAQIGIGPTTLPNWLAGTP